MTNVMLSALFALVIILTEKPTNTEKIVRGSPADTAVRRADYKKWQDGLDLLWKKTKNKELGEIRKDLRSNGYLIRQDPDSRLGFLDSPKGKAKPVGIILCTSEDIATFPTVKSRMRFSGVLSLFDPFKPPTIDLYSVPISEAGRGIIFARELYLNKEFDSDPAEWKNNIFFRVHMEVSSHDFLNELLLQYGKQSYIEILEKEITSIKAIDESAPEQLKMIRSLGYKPELDTIFGKYESTEERCVREMYFHIHAMLVFLERKYTKGMNNSDVPRQKAEWYYRWQRSVQGCHDD